jgi:hypothetical protein
MDRNERSRCAGIGVHVGPENAKAKRLGRRQATAEDRARVQARRKAHQNYASWRQKWHASEKGKAAQVRYAESPKGQAARRRALEKLNYQRAINRALQIIALEALEVRGGSS